MNNYNLSQPYYLSQPNYLLQSRSLEGNSFGQPLGSSGLIPGAPNNIRKRKAS